MQRDDLLDKLFFTTEDVQRTWKARFHESLQINGITHGQMYALFVLTQYQPINSKQFAAHMHLTPGAVTQLIDSLGEYVERKQDTKDRRIVYLRLSKSGSRLVKKIREKRKAFFVQVTASFSDQELATMLDEQRKFLDQLEKI